MKIAIAHTKLDRSYSWCVIRTRARHTMNEGMNEYVQWVIMDIFLDSFHPSRFHASLCRDVSVEPTRITTGKTGSVFLTTTISFPIWIRESYPRFRRASKAEKMESEVSVKVRKVREAQIGRVREGHIWVPDSHRPWIAFFGHFRFVGQQMERDRTSVERSEYI